MSRQKGIEDLKKLNALFPRGTDFRPAFPLETMELREPLQEQYSSIQLFGMYTPEQLRGIADFMGGV